MNNIIDLNFEELLTINGGCKKCKNAGREIGKSIRESAAWAAVESAWDEVSSWFD